MSFLRLEGIAKRYGPVRALEAIDLGVEAGSRTAIVGPSGSGKSTLLRIVAGFEAPDAGRVVLDGHCLAEAGRIVPPHKRSIGVVSQDGALFPHLDVADNIGFGLDRRHPARKARIAELMEMVDLGPAFAARRPHELSGGQQQRVALARALARAPKLMLLDEPFSALDTGLREAMRRAVAEVLERAGVASLLVTHDQSEALSFADQVAVLRDGRLAQAGPPRRLYFAPADPGTAAFLGDAVLLDATLGEGFADCALGRVPADTGARRGVARLMLRPEQLRIAPAGLGAPDGSTACRAHVTELEFAGPACTVVLELAPAGEAPEPIRVRLRMPSLEAPAAGDLVEVRVVGRAHLFEDTAAAAG